MPLLYNVPRLHQFRLGYCKNYFDHLPSVIVKQVQADGPNPGATNYCWLLAPSIASSESIGELYLGLNETHPQRSWGTLDRMTALFGLVQGGLTGEQQTALVKNGALFQADNPLDTPLTIASLYKTMGLVNVPVTDVYNPNSATDAQMASLEQYLKKYGPILLLRPAGLGGHIEAVAGVAKLKNLDDDKIYDCALVSSTQPHDGSDRGKFEARPLVDLQGYARNGSLTFYRCGSKPADIAPFEDLWRTMFIRMDVLPIITTEFKSEKGFVEVA
ncbi:MAG TPA: papain-like cysteine protease family protein [Rhizomicrobium sp.]|jgi:hypothetical protein